MREFPSQETLEKAQAVSDEIRDYEGEMSARGYGFEPLVLENGIKVFSGVGKNGRPRICIGEFNICKNLGEVSIRPRIEIWDLLKEKLK